jgi:uncharacterized protein
MEEHRRKLEHTLKVMFGDEQSGHDLHHLQRVSSLALHIQEREGGDRQVIGTAAFLHDVHRLMQNESGVFVHPRDSLPKVRELLKQIDFPEDRVRNVLHCVEFHEEYEFSRDGRTVDDIETLILQDADNLDAMGAIGIGRAFAYSGAHGIAAWIPDLPFDSEGAYDESMMDKSVIHHFHHKLLRLGASMNTRTGREMAQARHNFMEAFVKKFISEWSREA